MMSLYIYHRIKVLYYYEDVPRKIESCLSQAESYLVFSNKMITAENKKVYWINGICTL